MGPLAATPPPPLTPEWRIVFEYIFNEISHGRTLLQVCQDDPPPGAKRMPTRRSVTWYLNGPLPEHQVLRERMAEATVQQAASMAEDIIAIADDKTEDAQSRAVRIKSRQWFAGLVYDNSPWRERVKHDHEHQHVMLTPEQRQAEIDRLLQKRSLPSNVVALEDHRREDG